MQTIGGGSVTGMQITSKRKRLDVRRRGTEIKDTGGLIPTMGTETCESPSDHETASTLSQSLKSACSDWIIVELAQQHHEQILHCGTLNLTEQTLSIKMIVNKVSDGDYKALDKSIDHVIEGCSNWHIKWGKIIKKQHQKSTQHSCKQLGGGLSLE